MIVAYNDIQKNHKQPHDNAHVNFTDTKGNILYAMRHNVTGKKILD